MLTLQSIANTVARRQARVGRAKRKGGTRQRANIAELCDLLQDLHLVLRARRADELAEYYSDRAWPERRRIASEALKGESKRGKGYEFDASWAAHIFKVEREVLREYPWGDVAAYFARRPRRR
jgi:hypothetical protein